MTQILVVHSESLDTAEPQAVFITLVQRDMGCRVLLERLLADKSSRREKTLETIFKGCKYRGGGWGGWQFICPALSCLRGCLDGPPSSFRPVLAGSSPRPPRTCPSIAALTLGCSCSLVYKDAQDLAPSSVCLTLVGASPWPRCTCNS